jgi:hypothetical protein
VSSTFLYVGGASQAQAQIRIYGLTLAMINQLSDTGPTSLVLMNNTILVAAGDEDGAMSVVYKGQINRAYADFQSAPEVAFVIIALAAPVDAVRPVGAKSYVGAVDAAVVMKDIADTMKLTFENSTNLSVILSNPYFPGTAVQQLKDCAKAAGISYSIEFGKLAIWPKNSHRKISAPIKISPETGMVGYPTTQSQGLTVTTLFNPDLVLAQQIEVKSELQVANGIWEIYSAVHSLESETPNGQWFTQVNCNRPING